MSKDNKQNTKYIGFIDSDDLISQNYYEILITTLKNHNTLIAKTKNIIKFSNINYVKDKIKSNNFIKNNSYVFDTTKNLAYKTEPFRGVYDISLFKTLRFPNVRNGEDVPFGICANAIAKYIAFSKDAIYLYRQRKDSLSGLNNQSKMTYEGFIGFEYIYNFFKENDLLTKYTIPNDMIKPKLKHDLENPNYFNDLFNMVKSWNLSKDILNKNPSFKMVLESKNLNEYLTKVRTLKDKWKQNFKIKFNKKQKIIKLFGKVFYQK